MGLDGIFDEHHGWMDDTWIWLLLLGLDCAYMMSRERRSEV